MAVTVKKITTIDTRSGRAGTPERDVHYIKVGKGNRKGTAEAVGGQLYDHVGNKSLGDFHINLVTTVNKKTKTIILQAGDVVFKTGTSDRWQAISLKGFRKRFPEARI